MRYLGNDTNIVRDADLDASNGVGSDAIYRTDTAPKEGGGSVVLTGPYTGAADTVIDVEVVDNGGATTTVSAPVFSGIGNGTMTGVSAEDIDPQTVTVTLEDPGTETRVAYASFQGTNLQARTAGAGGNLIAIDVDHSALVDGETDWSLQEALEQDKNEYLGDHWNFGAAVLEPDGSIPADAPRVRFGSDPQVYRAWKRYRDGRYVYSFTPAPVRSVVEGARVHAVTGARTVTITNGTTTEVLPGIVTLYDALSAIRDDSTLVRVDGAISNGRKPGEMGTTELSVRTRSYVLGVTADGSRAVQRAELNVSALDTAPTETLRIICADATSAGNEQWDVQGDVSGDLPSATTGLPYTGGRYSFTIPLPEVDPSQTTGTIHVELILAERDGPGTVPTLCVVRPRLGSAARDGDWTFTYTQRPPEGCDCTTGELEGGPSDECLGITPGVDDMSDASVIVRMQLLASEVRKLVGSNTPDVPSLAYNTDGGDVNMVLTTAKTVRDALTGAAGGKLAYPVWVASTVYAQDTIAETTDRDGYRYAATTGGTSGATEPTWDDEVGATTADGTVVWTNIGKVALEMWDDLFAQWSAEMELLMGIGTSTALQYDVWAATTAITEGVRPLTKNGHLYRLFSSSGAGLTGATEPTWTTDGSTVTDGDIVWIDAGAYWNATTAYAKSYRMLPGTGVMMRAYVGGVSGATEPNWPGPEAIPSDPTIPLLITDGTVQWAAYPLGATAQSGDYVPDVEYYERWKTLAEEVLTAAELTPNFDVAGNNGDGCWHDFNDDPGWFTYDGTDRNYLPIQPGHYYHSAEQVLDADGNPYAQTTREWGFGPKFGCPESLIYGDQIRIVVRGASGSGGRGYQAGDELDVQVTQASPLPFGGGQTGNDTQTWTVVLTDENGDETVLDNYELLTTAPGAYTVAIGAGTLAFLITPGAIGFQLNDRFSFTIEGGRFRWRQDGGAWSASLDIDTTVLVDGLTVTFTGGSAPSWVALDRWTFKAEATFGIEQVRTPLDGEFVWTGSTVIDIDPVDGAIIGVLIAGHRIPIDATVRLQGSDDGFSTTPLNVVIPWRRECMWLPQVADYADYRITCDRGGAIRWIYLGESTLLSLRSGIAELGQLVKRIRLPRAGVRKALAATVEHSALSQESVDELIAMLEHATEFDDSLFGIVPNDDEAECGLVRYSEDTLELPDLLSYQPRDTENRLITAQLQLEAAP